MNTSDPRKLLQPVKLGALNLKNSFIMAPLTRCRADQAQVPNDMMVQQYSLRSSFGLIITEASSVSSRSNTFNTSGNIYNQEQTAGWKKVVDAVHAKGGLIVAQLWHGGRTTTSVQIGGKQPIGPSPIAPQGINRYSNEQFQVPHELTTDEVKGVIEEFRQSALNALAAGYDGVELHSANSYLVDQFLKESSNQRTDQYGGSIENRSRFVLEALDALISVYGSDRVGIRLSPTGRTNGMYDSNPIGTLKYLFSEFEKRKIAFVELRRSSAFDLAFQLQEGQVKSDVQIPDFFKTIRPLYSGNIIANDGINLEEAEKLLSEGTAQAISFGLLSMANPDLVERYTNNWELGKKIEFENFYQGGENGYIDVPLYQPSHQETK